MHLTLSCELKSLSHVQLCNPMDWSMESRILEWVAFPSPGDLHNPGIKPRSPALQMDSLPAEPQGNPVGTGKSLNGTVSNVITSVLERPPYESSKDELETRKGCGKDVTEQKREAKTTKQTNYRPDVQSGYQTERNSPYFQNYLENSIVKT